MIRFVHCIRRRPEISDEAFRRHWSSRELALLFDRLERVSGAVRVERNLTLIIPENLQLMQERGSEEPYDAMLEVWWESGLVLAKRLATPEAERLLQELTAYQRQFIDFAESRRFFTEANSTTQ